MRFIETFFIGFGVGWLVVILIVLGVWYGWKFCVWYRIKREKMNRNRTTTPAPHPQVISELAALGSPPKHTAVNPLEKYEGWDLCTSIDGKMYWYNPTTRESRWRL